MVTISTLNSDLTKVLESEGTKVGKVLGEGTRREGTRTPMIVLPNVTQPLGGGTRTPMIVLPNVTQPLETPNSDLK